MSPVELLLPYLYHLACWGFSSSDARLACTCQPKFMVGHCSFDEESPRYRRSVLIAAHITLFLSLRQTENKKSRDEFKHVRRRASLDAT